MKLAPKTLLGLRDGKPTFIGKTAEELAFLNASAGIREGSSEKIEDLLARGVNPNVLDDNGNSGLHLAASNQKPALVKQLLKLGVDASLSNLDGMTALHFSESCSSDVVEMLVAHGANPNQLSNPPMSLSPMMRFVISPSKKTGPMLGLAKVGAFIDISARKVPVLLKRVNEAKLAYDAFIDDTNHSTRLPNAQEIILFANIGHHHDVMLPERWRDAMPQLSSLLATLPQWLALDIIAAQPELGQILNHTPSPIIQDWSADRLFDRFAQRQVS